MTRRELKKIAKELIECNENWEVQNEYRLALIHKDIKAIQYFQSMGRTVRHSIMNVDEYRHRLKFGFTEIKFNDSGWLEKFEWAEEETIEVKTNDKADKKFVGNYIRFAKGLNGLWVWSVSASYGNGGEGWAPSVFSEPLKSKDEALKAGADYLKELHKKRFSESYSNKVLKWMEQNLVFQEQEQGQLSLF
jgi:hypothetical protein